MELPQSVKDSLESSKAEYRQLGKSGLRVSVPIFGAMSFGDPAWMQWVIKEDEVSLPIRARTTTFKLIVTEGIAST